MKTLILAALVLASSGAQAFFITTTPMALPTYSTNSTSGNNYKLVIDQAKEDASAYIATDGQIQGPYLNRALEMIRKNHPDTAASDAELAKAILAEP